MGFGSLPTRAKAFPDIPSADEAGIGHITARTWAALVAPAKTPGTVIGRLNRELNAALARAQQACCDEVEAQLRVACVDAVEERFVSMFREEWRRQRRGAGARRRDRRDRP